jgi:hypothetical protein
VQHVVAIRRATHGVLELAECDLLLLLQPSADRAFRASSPLREHFALVGRTLQKFRRLKNASPS